MDQQRAPLYEALSARSLKQEASFHVPGHKFGSGLAADEEKHYDAIMKMDYTEIPGLDDLHDPGGIILEAQRLAASCFGAEESFFLVGGSTVGNMAVIATVCSRGDMILVQRNAHKSVIHGLMLAGARAVFLHPPVDEASGIAGSISLEALREALGKYPEAKGVFLTNPNYYGMGRDLAPYAEAAHEFGVPLLVDEAHGAHFGFHPEAPPSALSRGADAVVQSTHKMLTAMTMGAMLHVQGGLLNRRRLKERLATLQSSSPSYPLMASLDLARRRVATAGEKQMEQVLRQLTKFRSSMACFKQLRCRLPDQRSAAYDYMDPFKLIVYDAAGGCSGFQLLKELGAEGINGEMADDRHVILACSLATQEQELERLKLALQAIDNRLTSAAAPDKSRGETHPMRVEAALGFGAGEEISEPVAMEWDDSDVEGSVRVPLDEAAGRQSAQSVIPYPPGIPLLFPGEVIRLPVIEYMKKLIAAGARFQGNLQEGSGCSILIKKTNGE